MPIPIMLAVSTMYMKIQSLFMNVFGLPHHSESIFDANDLTRVFMTASTAVIWALFCVISKRMISNKLFFVLYITMILAAMFCLSDHLILCMLYR